MRDKTLPALQRARAVKWERALGRVINDVPRPALRGVANTPGADPDRVLLLGGGIALGLGAADHVLAVPGHLARELSALTGRGSDVFVRSHEAMSFRSAFDQMRVVREGLFDAIVVTLGEVEAARSTPLQQVRALAVALIDALRQATTRFTPIVLVGVRPIVSLARKATRYGERLQRRADRINTILEEVAATHGVSYLTPQDVHERIDASVRTRYHHRYATAIASVLAPSLELARERGVCPARVHRPVELDERERQRSLDAMDVLDTPSDATLNRITALASEMFRTRGAAVQLIDRDRSYIKSAVGIPAGGSVPRSGTLCATVVQEGRPLIVGDARTDERFADFARVRSGEVCFYAGYPLEAPDGSRIGALCIFDSEPRSVDSVDSTALRSLALLVQARLHDWSGRAR